MTILYDAITNTPADIAWKVTAKYSTQTWSFVLAIKEFRELNRTSLRDAKDTVEEYMKAHEAYDAPKPRDYIENVTAIFKKYDAGDALDDHELVSLLRHYNKLDNALCFLGDSNYNLVKSDVFRHINTLTGFAIARGIVTAV